MSSEALELKGNLRMAKLAYEKAQEEHKKFD